MQPHASGSSGVFVLEQHIMPTHQLFSQFGVCESAASDTLFEIGRT